jgi:hypothetical protein
MNKLFCLVLALFAVTTYAVKYKAQFVGMWSAEHLGSGMTDYLPDGAGFSDLILVSHNEDYAPFEEGEVATDAFATYVTTGESSDLMDEIDAAIAAGQALDYKDIKGILGNERTHFSFMVNETFPYITLAARLNPSPDWFTGFSHMSLMKKKGQYLKRGMMQLMIYDAGVDAGTDMSSHVAMEERDEISALKNSFGKMVKYIAKFRFSMVECSQYMDMESCSAYQCRWVDEVEACRNNYETAKPWALQG